MTARAIQDDTITLTSGRTSLGVLPGVGGALAWLTVDGQDLLRPFAPPPDDPNPERHSAGYPLVPYSNRIAGGRFNWLDQQIELSRNFGDHPHSIHGFGWQNAWTATRQTEQQTTLELAHYSDDQWPWPCTASQTINVSHDRVELSLSVHNRGESAMPAGLGWHPYFQRTERMRLQFKARRVWTTDAQQLPQRPITVPGYWDFSHERRLDWPDLDHCFSDWDGNARIFWPEYGLRLTMHCPGSVNHLVVFTPRERDFIAVEPVTHVNNALNLYNPTTQGIAILAPGETMTRHLIMTVENDHETD